MAFRRLPLPAHVRGALWLDAMPGRLQPWPQFVAEAERAGLTRIVCLTEMHEISGVSPDYHRAIADRSLPCRWVPLPMVDFGLSEEAEKFREGVIRLADELVAGEVVLLHCAAGIGRTGTVAACLLKRLGLSSVEALHRVQAAGSNPQSAVQWGLIERF
jgi:atypical dual specificity phosphatase